MGNRWFVIIRGVRVLSSGMARARKPEKINTEDINLRNVIISHS